LIPALLFFFAVFLQVYFEARRLNLPSIPKDEIPNLKQVIIRQGYLALPIIAIIAFIMMGYSPMRAGFYGVAVAWGISLLKKSSRMGFGKIVIAMQKAARAIVSVAIACACAGIVIAVIRSTGLGLKFTSAIIGLAGDNLLFAMVLTMLAALILGMGLPTAAAYVIQAALAAPALIQLGLLPIQAHLFIFYFSSISAISPPVPLAGFAAATLCDGDPLTVGVKAFRLGLAAFIIPYMFAFGPALLLIGSVQDLLIALPTALLGITAFAIGLSGWLWARTNVLIRMLFFASAMGLMLQGIVSDLIGISLLVAAILLQRSILRKAAQKNITM